MNDDLGLPQQEADIYKSGMFIMMDSIDMSTCKDAIEFILKQSCERKKQKRLQFLTLMETWLTDQ